jgi:hypothetical protein
MASVKIRFTSTRPALQHNARLANPLDPIARGVKKYSSKTKKTDEDHEAMAHLEMQGSLYLDHGGEVVWPTENFEASVVDAAKTRKLGKDVKRSGFRAIENEVPLYVDGRRISLKEVMEDQKYWFQKSVRVNSSRVPRTRPIISNWVCEAEFVFDSEVLDPVILEELLVIAGSQIGVGDWRPKFGLYEAEILK